ncbi:MAG: hypothetical protein Tsb0014_45250 [Pleurocapsa sp.]
MSNNKCLMLLSFVVINVFCQLGNVKAVEAFDNSKFIKQSDRIVCLSASGNGYNWASTLTWAAEILRNTVEQAPAAKTFNVACVSGASSGSAFVAVYGSLLQNKKLFNRVGFNPKSATKEEVLILAKSLIYMGLAVDFSPEVVGFYLTKDGDSHPNPPWWKSGYSHERIMLDFGSKIMLAQNISLQDVAEVDRLNQFIIYQSLAELKQAAKSRKNRAQYRRVTLDIWAKSEQIIEELYKDANFPRSARQQDRDDFKNNLDHPVRRALAQSLPDGIISLTYGELAYTRATVDYKKMRQQPPPFKTLVPFVFTNRNTAQQIINSNFYQQQVQNNDPYVGQYVISIVPDYFTLIRHGLREPGLSPVGIHNLLPDTNKLPLDTVAGISRYYQPIAEKNWESSPQFRLISSVRSLPQNGEFYRPRIGIAGGWVDSFVGGQATVYLGASYGLKQQKSQIIYSTFSRENEVTPFAINVLKEYFAPENTQQAIMSLEKHRQHLPKLINSYNQRYANHQITWQPIFVDWEISFFLENQNLLEKIVSGIDNIIKLGYNKLPAATVQQSNYLVAKTINTVRQTLKSQKNYIYDRTYKH